MPSLPCRTASCSVAGASRPAAAAELPLPHGAAAVARQESQGGSGFAGFVDNFDPQVAVELVDTPRTGGAGLNPHLNQLVDEMGFEPAAAKRALELAGYDLQHAVQILMG